MSNVRISGDRMAATFIPCCLVLLMVPLAIVMWPEDPGKLELYIDTVRLTAFRDGSGISVVDAEIVIAASKHVPISLAGDVKTKHLSNGWLYGNWETRSGDGVIIHYNGLLQLIEPKAAGDTVNILVLYGNGNDSETARAVVEEP